VVRVEIDPMLEIPTGFFYLPVPIGSTLMALAFLQVALKRIVDVTAEPDSSVASGTGLR
jgi:TRAP-type C4-dicarboxylate transport system permease small subunit